MESQDKRRQFDEIADRLSADYPSLARSGAGRWSRPVLVCLSVLAGLGWGLLSVSMVAWGWKGVTLTVTCVVVTVLVGVVGSRRRPRR